MPAVSRQSEWDRLITRSTRFVSLFDLLLIISSTKKKYPGNPNTGSPDIKYFLIYP